jgi:histone H3/H4
LAGIKGDLGCDQLFPFVDWELNDAAITYETEVKGLMKSLLDRREAGLRQLTGFVDRWIDSGRTPEGGEAAMNRSYERIPDATAAAHEFFRESKHLMMFPGMPNPDVWLLPPGIFKELVGSPGSTDPTLQLLPPDGGDFERIDWRVQKLISIILCSDLRYRIARCRGLVSKGKTCGRYFLLNDRQTKKTFKRGTFCDENHRQLFTATEAMRSKRAKVHAWRIATAAGYVATRRKTDEWFADRNFKRLIKNYVNDHRRRQSLDAGRIEQSWITRNQADIENKAAEIRSARGRRAEMRRRGGNVFYGLI